MGYYPGERTITSVDIDLHMDTTKLTHIWTKTYQDVNAPLVTEYRVDAYYPGIGGQTDDPDEPPVLPVTGDNTNLPLLVGMLVLSLGVLVVLLRRRKTM